MIVYPSRWWKRLGYLGKIVTTAPPPLPRRSDVNGAIAGNGVGVGVSVGWVGEMEEKGPRNNRGRPGPSPHAGSPPPFPPFIFWRGAFSFSGSSFFSVPGTSTPS